MDAGNPAGPNTGQMKVRCCVVGGGPAGMMLGYLLGRAGIDVVVLEKHADFFRDFRGDTVHPSTLQVMDELGLIDGFLKLPHQDIQKLDGMFGGTSVRIADLSRLSVKYPFIAMMPQWDFLNFLRDSGKRFPSLQVLMSAEATDLIRRGDAVAGVRVTTPDGTIDIEADLVIGCDGRRSIVRERAGLAVEEIGAPIDVLWFRVGRHPDETENLFARVDHGKMMVTFDRGDYWQCAYVIAKGQYDAVKARGLPALLDDVLRAIAAEIDRTCSVRERAVIACSALKRSYRDILVHGRDDVRIIFLDGTQELIATRLAARKDHFMPPGLLASQFKTLEPPTPDERPIIVAIDRSVDTIIEDIVNQLKLDRP